MAEALVAQGLSAVSLHGGRSQNEREAALQNFRSSSTSILVISSTLLEHNTFSTSMVFLSLFIYCKFLVICNILSSLISRVKPGVVCQNTMKPALACCIHFVFASNMENKFMYKLK